MEDKKVKVVYNWYIDCKSGTTTLKTGMTKSPLDYGAWANSIANKHAQKRNRIVLDVWVVDPSEE